MSSHRSNRVRPWTALMVALGLLVAVVPAGATPLQATGIRRLLDGRAAAVGSTTLVRIPPGTRIEPPVSHLRDNPVGADLPTGSSPRRGGTATGKSARNTGAIPAPASCAHGRWLYSDTTGRLRPARSWSVFLWDKDANSDDEYLAGTLVDGDGTWYACFLSEDGDESGTADVFVVFVASNDRWQVEWNGEEYRHSTRETAVFADALPYTSTNFGERVPADPGHMGAPRVFDAAKDAWDWVGASCWDERDAATRACRKVRLAWSPTSRETTSYEFDMNLVLLNAAAASVPSAVVHEIGHAVMDDVYEDQIPDGFICPNHEPRRQSNAECAWSEGFAEWFQASVYRDPVIRNTQNQPVNLETPTWGTPNWANGDRVEGRVAGSLIDVVDTTNEDYWDRSAEGLLEGGLGSKGTIWQVFLDTGPHKTFAEFWAAWSVDDAFDATDRGGRATLYQNTIDYGFRDPLDEGQPLTRPSPPADRHRYQFTPSRESWAVVAVRPRPAATGNVDLRIYTDPAMTDALGRSLELRGTIDLVGIDFHRRRFNYPYDSYYPEVSGFDADYDVEYAQSSAVADDASPVGLMGSSSVVAVYETFMSGAGSSRTVTVTPGQDLDVEVLVLGSQADNPFTWVRARSDALASASEHGPGEAEEVTFTATDVGWHAIVVLNKSGVGEFIVERS